MSINIAIIKIVVVIFNLCGAVAVVETHVGASLRWRRWELVLAWDDDLVDDDRAHDDADYDDDGVGDDNNDDDDGVDGDDDDDGFDQMQGGDP